MKTLIIVLVLLGTSFSTVTITLNDKCTCTKIKSKSDCINLSCSWLNDACVDSTTTTETIPISVYCTSLDSTTCPTIKGCALIGGNCEQFSGCSAYSGSSNDVCYQISNQCTSDGTQCTNPLNCVDYTTEILCSSNINSSGRRCKWENSACRNLKCIEASTTLATDTDCNSFLPGCLTNGKGCVESRGTCSSYVNNCAGMIGSDGYCEVNGTNCQAKLCTVASTDLNSDAQCAKFQVGCITNGRGCVLNTLPSCSTYTGDATVCQQMIGSEGKCDGGTSNTCQARECKNASTSNNTDLLCKSYLSTCITNGAGCVLSLPLCNTYTGDSTLCNQYIGIDGKCTLGTNGCKARVCSEAANTLITDTDCAAYQNGCVTNGQGCVSTRLLCSQYNGTAATCLKYVGSDGKCTGVGDSIAACSLQNCSTAPTTYTNNNQCSLYQNNCLTNGQGCVYKTTCPATIAEISCTGTTSCQWTNVCVTNTSCQYYNTISLCYNNLANGKSCFWSNNVCRLRLCTDAPNTYTTNQQCDTFLQGCLTTGNGCLASTAPCASYNGTLTTCVNFIGNGIKCTSLSASNAACIDVTCESNTTATDQNTCDLHLLGCKFQGSSGCISPTVGCAIYSGNQDACNTYRGENGTVKCYQDTGVVSNCRNLVCGDNTTATSDAECKTFMSTCLTMGTGCISATSPCTSYPGSSNCNLFTGNLKACWWEGGSYCVDKLCTHNTTSTSDDTCNQFLSGCVTSGIGCISKTEICTSYQGNESQCQAFKGNGIPCARKNACQNRRCSDVLNPTNSGTCTNYLSTCRFNGSACIDSQSACTGYTNLNYQICQQITTSTGGTCYLGSGQGQCLTRVCSQAGQVNSQTDCDTFLTGCIFTGSTCTDKVAACESYTNFTPLACESAITTSSTLCWRAQNTIGACATRSCASVTASLNPYSFSTTFCVQYLSTCRYNGNICVSEQAACASYTGFNQAACKATTTSSGEICWMESATGTVCASRSCSDTVQAPNDTNCKAHKSTCRYNGTSCVDSQTACNLYTGFTSNACQEVSLTNGTTYCWSPSSGSTCQSRACTDVLTTYTTANCVNHLSTCTYNGTQCVNAQADCTSYTGFTTSACQAAQTTSGAYCWTPIAVPSQCTNRQCSYSISSPSEINCPSFKSSCRYNGSICVDQQSSCSQYTSFTQIACQKTTTQGGAKCWKSSSSQGTCEDRNCSNAVINPNYTTCVAHLSSCTYDGTGCYPVQASCNLYTNLTAAQCQNLLTSSGGKCWLAYGSGTCQVRQCTHNTVATTDVECATFLTGCRTTGQGCVDSATVCSSYIGTVSSCFTFVGNSIPCTGVDSSGPCTNKNCQDNMDATTDLGCSNFMSGCLARSKGCISGTQTCSSYLGTQLVCSLFKGNGKNCWNTSNAAVNTQCREKLCTDDTTSITDSDCQNVQSNCVTNGRGCIDITATCSQYTGTQAQCSQFKGLNGTKLCWNSSTATPLTACVDRVCSHNNSATSDNDCNTFLSGCVTKGYGCVAPQPCSSFLGTSKTCPTFTATDRPCKGTTSTTQSSCVAVKCNEAPNSYNTDQLCNTFKEGCVTNGFGCVISVNCEDIQTQKACQSKSSCTYSGNCKDLQTNCSVFTSQSVCVNTPVNTINGMCAWDQNATTGIGSCRNWTCTDASYSLQTHQDCYTLWDKCTTKGRGCVLMGACSTYTDSTTCTAATTSDEGSFCVWNSTVCRSLNCSDASTDFNTDTKCQQFLSNCLTSGKGCISKEYKCSEILTKDKCLTDYQGNTCLWTIYGCKTFTKCTDISGVAYAQCQQYSTKCTSNGTTCIALAPCSNYTNPTSCQIGTDGQCGWITATLNTAAHCTKFTQCSDGVGITNELCQQFSTLCVSDGVGCISIGPCTSYLTSVACQSEGSDGFCFWDATVCRLRTCTDATVATAIEITSHSKCNAFKATTSCTTNGTNCVSMGLCTSYKEAGCYFGTDGECIYDLPSGQVQGTKSCRLKVCTDYTEVTTELCQLHKSSCVSNGTYCITKNNCATYKTKVSCNSGGLDGICVFTPSVSDVNTGTCALMTTCSQANSDAIACKSKYNACSYLVSLQSGVQVTSCIDNSCTTIATGSNCKPLYSFDEKSISVCLTTSTGCSIGDPSQLSASTCFASSMYTYTWNSVTNLCQKCTSTSNQTNSTTNNTNSTNQTTSFAQILIFPLALILL